MARHLITDLLKETIGVDSTTMGSSAIDNAVRQRLEACGLDGVEAYWKLLNRSEEELTHLVELVVVPETWFFRDAEALTALAQQVRETWGPAHPSGRFRVLSAPCSTGEEPYSIAMALLDAGLPTVRFHLDAIDISSRALAQARRAVYGRNSFRGTGVEFRDRYFREERGLYRLLPLVRECVEFRQANLVSDDLFTGPAGYDAIFCRNVLIYFDAPTQEKVIRALGRLLAPDGLLFVGPAEAFITRSAGFRPVNFPSAFAFRKPGPSALNGPSLTARPAASAPPPPKRRPSPPPVRKPAAKAVPLPAQGKKVEIAPAGPSLTDATKLADSGRLPEAVAVCETHLKERGPSVEGYFLLGLLREMLGHPEEAARCYRKVLYLDPKHSETLLHLALLAENQGNHAEARRLQQRARRNEEVTP